MMKSVDDDEMVDISSQPLRKPGKYDREREKSSKNVDGAAGRKRAKLGKGVMRRRDENELSSICESYPHLTRERGHACLLASCCSENACNLPLACWDALVDCMVPGRCRERWHSLEASQTCPAVGGAGEVSLPAAIAPCFLLRQSAQDCDRLHLSRVLFFFAHGLTVDTFVLALRAGFFVFAQPNDFSGQAQAGNGIVCLELAGQRREATDEEDHGGRVVLTDIQDLRVGKKTLKTVCDAEMDIDGSSGSGSGSKNRVPYRLQVSMEAEDGREVWEACERAHGVDWMGFVAAKDLYIRVWAQQQQQQQGYSNLTGSGSSGSDSDRVSSGKGSDEVQEQGQGQVRLVCISLVDDRDDTIVSVEIGALVGTLYSCISHATFDKVKYPRADRVRSNASALWLAKAGVRAIDVGTTAQYFVDLSGFSRTSREEFVTLWRDHRDECLESERFAAMLSPCRRVHSLLVAKAETIVE